MTDDLDRLDGEDLAEAYEAEELSDGLDGEALDAIDDLDGFGSFEEEFEDFDGLDEAGDFEGDAFFKKMFRRIGRGLKKFKFLRKLAPIAGRIAGGFIGGPLGAQIGGRIGGLLREDEAYDGFGEFEDYDGEDEDEALAEDSPAAYGLDGLSDGLAEELGALAAEAESEAEASALLGGVTIQVLSPAPVTVKRLTPVMVKGMTRLGRFLRRSRRTRPLVRAIPTIQKRATKMLTKHAQRGGRVTPRHARVAMAKATMKTLRSPKSAAKGLANNAVKRRRFRRINKKAVARAER